jgi:hypothetical protein
MSDRGTQPRITYEVLTVQPDGSKRVAERDLPIRAQAEQRKAQRAARRDERGRDVDEDGRPVIVEATVE